MDTPASIGNANETNHLGVQLSRYRESILRSQAMVEESKRWLAAYRASRDLRDSSVGGRHARQELYEALRSISPLSRRCGLGHHQEFSFGQYEPCSYCMPTVARCERCAADGINHGVAFWRDLGRFGFPSTRNRRLPLGMKDFCFMLCDKCFNLIKRRRENDSWLRSRLRPN